MEGFVARASVPQGFSVVGILGRRGGAKRL